MCERKTSKIRRGSQAIRQREMRRLQRLSRLVSRPVHPAPAVPCPQPSADKDAQCRLIIELAWKTIALMQKHTFIQQKITALRRETSEYVAAIMSNPENRRRYTENVRLHRIAQQARVSNYNDNTLIGLYPNL